MTQIMDISGRRSWEQGFCILGAYVYWHSISGFHAVYRRNGWCFAAVLPSRIELAVIHV